MLESLRSRAAALLTLTSLVVGGCYNESNQVSKPEATGPTPSMVPDWNTSVRLFEPQKGQWAVAVAGGKGVAVYEASEPKEGVNVEFGNKVQLPGWNTSLVMAKLQNDHWYVIAAGGSGVAITEARGIYSSEREVYVSDQKNLAGWNTSSRVVKMQDGHKYLVIAGGAGIGVRPFDPVENPR